MNIRPATDTDRSAILRLMRPRDYNRINLRPACFVVAEEAGTILGIGQIKRHRDGTAELASLVVAANRRSEGIGRTLVRALVAQRQGALYLFCLAELENFYARLGFQPVAQRQLPLLLAFLHGVGNGLGQLPRFIGQSRLQIIVMQTMGGATKATH